jgi:hypothetical protein
MEEKNEERRSTLWIRHIRQAGFRIWSNMLKIMNFHVENY